MTGTNDQHHDGGPLDASPEGETALYELIAKTRRSLDDIETAVRLGFLRL